MRVSIVIILAGIFFVNAVPSGRPPKQTVSGHSTNQAGNVDPPKKSDSVEGITEGISNVNLNKGPKLVSTAIFNLTEMDHASDFVY